MVTGHDDDDGKIKPSSSPSASFALLPSILAAVGDIEEEEAALQMKAGERERELTLWAAWGPE